MAVIFNSNRDALEVSYKRGHRGLLWHTVARGTATALCGYAPRSLAWDEEVNALCGGPVCVGCSRVLTPLDPHPVWGERHGAAILTEANVRAIRARRETTGESYAKIAVDYRVKPVTIRDIVKRRSWKRLE